MTQLFGGLNNWDRVPEFRLLEKKRSGKASWQKALEEGVLHHSFCAGKPEFGDTILIMQTTA